MKKGLKPALLISMALLMLLLMNTYGRQSLQIDLAAENVQAGQEWRSYSPHLTLPKGRFEVLIHGEGSVELRSGDGTLLGTGLAQEPLEVVLKQDESDLILCGEWQGILTHVEVCRVKGGIIYTDWLWLSLGIAALALCLMLLLGQEKRERAVVFCVLLGVTVMASYPLFVPSVGFGHDLNFHLYRIEGIKDGLQAGQFPVRLHPTHNHGYGYISSSVYPELFLYFPALLRLMGASPVMAYNTFLAGINALTAWIMYACAKGITRSRYAGLLASVLYTLSTWRIMNLYYRAAIGEALAMVFFPVLLYGLYLLLAGDHRKWWVLALGCSGIFQSHIISTIFAALTILAAAAVYHRTFLQRQRFLGFVRAGALTVLLNLWYLVPFLTYYLGTDLTIKHTPENTEFFQNAVFPAEFFNVFNTSFGYSQLLDYGIRENMSLSLGVGGTVALAVCVIFFLLGGKEKSGRIRFYGFLTGTGLVLLFMASTLFPWQLLQRVGLINAFCGTVRMPWRFLSLVSPMLCIAAAGILARRGRQERKATACALLVLCSLAFIRWGTAYTTELTPVLKVGRAVDTYASAGFDDEYYPWGTDPQQLTPGRYVTWGSAGLTGCQKQGTRISLQLENVCAGDWVEVPLLYYAGYEAKDGLGRKLETVEGDNHVVRICLQAESSWVELRYRGFWYFRVAEGITLLTLGAWGICWWIKRRQTN